MLRSGIDDPVGPVVQLVAELVDRLLEQQHVEQRLQRLGGSWQQAGAGSTVRR
jgi:hypothetical protein